MQKRPYPLFIYYGIYPPFNMIYGHCFEFYKLKWFFAVLIWQTSFNATNVCLHVPVNHYMVIFAPLILACDSCKRFCLILKCHNSVVVREITWSFNLSDFKYSCSISGWTQQTKWGRNFHVAVFLFCVWIFKQCMQM